MCELLGISAKERRLANRQLREFFSHSVQHPHGWGLARFPEQGLPVIEKEPIRAVDSAYLKTRLDGQIKERNLIAHIRMATVGTMDYDNCHPFFRHDKSGRVWTLVHNGTIFNAPALNAFVETQKGRTDSERVLMFLVDRIDAEIDAVGRSLNYAERFEVVCKVVEELAPKNKLNLLIFDGETLFAHCNFKDTLHWSREDDAVIFSTKPLSEGMFEPVPFRRVIAVENGEVIEVGPDHGHEYIYNPDDYRFVYMDFSTL